MAMEEFVGGRPLADRVRVDALGADTFRAELDAGPVDIAFGGQLAGQAVMAAGATVDGERRLRSLHAYFVRTAQPHAEIEYRVERGHDGRSTSLRTVTAVQNGVRVFALSASFQSAEPITHAQISSPPAGDPDAAPVGMSAPLEIRPLRWAGADGAAAAGQQLWLRCPQPLPGDPLLHCAALAYASDLTLGWSPWKSVGVHRVVAPMTGASLDHAMWFHDAVSIDRWLLVDQHSQAVAGERGLAFASIFDASGRLVATAAQEGVMRGIRDARDHRFADGHQDRQEGRADDVFTIA